MTCKISEPPAGLINRKRSSRGPGSGDVKVCHRRLTCRALLIWTRATCSGLPRATLERVGRQCRLPTRELPQVQGSTSGSSWRPSSVTGNEAGVLTLMKHRSQNLPEHGPPDAGDQAPSAVTLHTPGVWAVGGRDKKGCKQEQGPCRVRL